MRNVVVAGLALAALTVSPQLSRAAVFAEPNVGIVSDLTLVSGGCGPGGFRAENGYCYPRRPPPPPFRRACPPGYHLTPYGCRPNF